MMMVFRPGFLGRTYASSNHLDLMRHWGWQALTADRDWAYVPAHCRQLSKRMPSRVEAMLWTNLIVSQVGLCFVSFCMAL